MRRLYVNVYIGTADQVRAQKYGDLPEEALPGLAALARRSEALAGIVQELHACERQGRLQGTIGNILISYLHMFINRLSRSAGPEHEMVLYDFLAQIYSSLRARASKANQARPVAASA